MFSALEVRIRKETSIAYSDSLSRCLPVEADKSHETVRAGLCLGLKPETSEHEVNLLPSVKPCSLV